MSDTKKYHRETEIGFAVTILLMNLSVISAVFAVFWLCYSLIAQLGNFSLILGKMGNV